jgi:uncharacterized protein YjbJ (UPF0337 family)
MNKNIIKGNIKQIKGKLIDAKGDITGNPADDIRGKTLVAAGKAQEMVGEVQAAVAKKANRKPKKPSKR